MRSRRRDNFPVARFKRIQRLEWLGEENKRESAAEQLYIDNIPVGLSESDDSSVSVLTEDSSGLSILRHWAWDSRKQIQSYALTLKLLMQLSMLYARRGAGWGRHGIGWGLYSQRKNWSRTTGSPSLNYVVYPTAFVYIANCTGKPLIVKKRCVNNHLIWNKFFEPQMCLKL